jgi:hypothetical protein
MNTRPSGLAAFVKRPATPTSAATPGPGPAPAGTSAAAGPSRPRGQKPVVSMTFRLPRKDWERLHQLAIAEGQSINSLALRGLSRLFEERGLPGIGASED